MTDARKVAFRQIAEASLAADTLVPRCLPDGRRYLRYSGGGSFNVSIDSGASLGAVNTNYATTAFATHTFTVACRSWYSLGSGRGGRSQGYGHRLSEFVGKLTAEASLQKTRTLARQSRANRPSQRAPLRPNRSSMIFHEDLSKRRATGCQICRSRHLDRLIAALS
jgi:hypothetical protein